MHKIQDFLTINQNRSSEYAFLHIGKTAGSAISDLIIFLSKQGLVPPSKFIHCWTLEDIVTFLPNIKISCIIRDPIERICSGFESRKRMGRPRNHVLWSSDEAIAFSYFSSPKALLEALVGEDDRLKSAGEFAMHAIRHLRRSYQFYFKSIEFIHLNLQKFYAILPFEKINLEVYKIFLPCNIDRTLALKHFSYAHINPNKTTQLYTDTLSTELVSKIKRYLSPEYEIYEYLSQYCICTQ